LENDPSKPASFWGQKKRETHALSGKKVEGVRGEKKKAKTARSRQFSQLGGGKKRSKLGELSLGRRRNTNI